MCLMVLGTKNFETIRKSSIGIDRAEREGCLLPERQEDGSRRKQKIIFYMKGWLQNVKTKIFMIMIYFTKTSRKYVAKKSILMILLRHQ